MKISASERGLRVDFTVSWTAPQWTPWEQKKVAIVERLKWVSRRLKILEWISWYEIFPAQSPKVCHLFSRLDFSTRKIQLFCVVWAILIIMWLVGSKPCNQVICFARQKHLFHMFCVLANPWLSESIFIPNWCHVPCIMTSSTIPSLSVLNDIWIHGGLTVLLHLSQ